MFAVVTLHEKSNGCIFDDKTSKLYNLVSIHIYIFV